MYSALLWLAVFVLFVCAVRVAAVQLKSPGPQTPPQADKTEKNSFFK